MYSRILFLFLTFLNALCIYGEKTETSSLQVSQTQLEESLKKHIHYNPDGPNQIGRIAINDRNGSISEATWLYVKKALEHYKESKPIFIILELNTPGGEVYAAQQISDALKEFDIQQNIPVIAFINNWAISAGAMIAYSSRYIAVVKDASMGAAEPVVQDDLGELVSASEKINSALRTDFANRARFFDRNPDLAEAMVDKDIILVLRKGKIKRLDNESQIKSGKQPDIIISPKGKLLTLSSDQLIKYGVADILVEPIKIESITDIEKAEGQWPADKELLFQAPFLKNIPNATIDSYKMDWKTQFFVFLASPAVSSLLILALVWGAYLEFTTPGFTLPGSLAAIALFLIILSSFSLDLANWLEVIFVFTGIAILLVEFFVLPTFGLLGFFGVLLFIVGLFGMLLPQINNIDFDFDSFSFNIAGQAFFERLGWLCATLVFSILLIFIFGRYLPKSFGAYENLVSEGNEQNASKGYVAGIMHTALPKIGSKGVVASTLRPSGKVVINDVYYDAISEGSLIEKNSAIEVIGYDESTLIVQEY